MVPVVCEQVVRIHAATLCLNELKRCQAILDALPVYRQDLVVDEVLCSMQYMCVCVYLCCIYIHTHTCVCVCVSCVCVCVCVYNCAAFTNCQSSSACVQRSKTVGLEWMAKFGIGSLRHCL
jgi:hypothetical protein